MSQTLLFSTDSLPPPDRASGWTSIVAEAYFPLQLHFIEPLKFAGQLSRMEMGHVSLSRLTSAPASYERRQAHIRESRREEYLVTIPRTSAVKFRQLGREVSCEPGGFILERGDEPYRFMYERPNDLFVAKVSKSALSERIRQPDRFCARTINATSGAANLFVTMVQHGHNQFPSSGPTVGETIGRQLLELLGLALEEQSGVEVSGESAVRAAHLVRVDQFIRGNLKNHDLSPDLIAEGCGVSKRYLHDLFKDVNGTVSQQIRDQRLIAARDRLGTIGNITIAEVSYRFGFADQAQFSRLFKARFGLPPSEYRIGLFQSNPTVAE
ncbi:AraC family transcriptional regulator [bacterium]|nr:AraC family transcriptional regulator [bacterium]